MKNVLIYSDHMMGHLIPTYSIAQNLKDHGYVVKYIGPENVQKAVSERGFDTHVPSLNVARNESLLVAILSGALDSWMRTVKPYVILATAHDPLVALVLYYKYRIKTILIWSHFPVDSTFTDPSFSPYVERAKNFAQEQVTMINPVEIDQMLSLLQRQGHFIRRLDDFFLPFNRFAHFITCSQELYYTDIANREEEIYLGPSLCDNTNSLSIGWEKDAKLQAAQHLKRPLIYCALGSCADDLPEAKWKAIKLYRFLIQAMQQEQLHEYHLVLSAGNLLDALQGLPVPENVSIHKWLPQVALLKEADLAIIHCGMGSLKECIQASVPILAYPLGKDQFENAKMVTTRNLGRLLEVSNEGIEVFSRLVKEMVSDRQIRTSLQQMKSNFDRDAAARNELAYIASFQSVPSY